MPKNLNHCEAVRKIFSPARGVRGHAPPENFENLTSQMAIAITWNSRNYRNFLTAKFQVPSYRYFPRDTEKR